MGKDHDDRELEQHIKACGGGEHGVSMPELPYPPPLSLVSAPGHQAITVKQTAALAGTVPGSEETRPPAGAMQMSHSRAIGAVLPGQTDGKVNSSRVYSCFGFASGQCRQYSLRSGLVMVAHVPIVSTFCGTCDR